MQELQQVIDQIRQFNRFYTVLLGFLNRDYLDSGYSVTETRLLFEVARSGQISANRLIAMLGLDKSYVSRLIRGFEQRGLIERAPNPGDRRALLIRLTPGGQAEAERLIGITNAQLAALIEPLSAPQRRDVCRAMETIQNSFQTGAAAPEYFEQE